MIQAVHPPAVPDGILLATLRKRIRTRVPLSPTLQAVTLLLSAREVGQNIDRLARFTGLERSFVARCARRLIDNGVWRNDETICDWQVEGVSHPGFWNDVAVAEGKLCRRINEQGIIEWAPPGQWRKNYDFVPREPVEELNVRYHPADAGEPGDVESASDEPEYERSLEETPTAVQDSTVPAPVQDPATPAPKRRRRKSALRPPVARQPLLLGFSRRRFADDAAPSREPTPRTPPRPTQPPELFPDAVWLE